MPEPDKPRPPVEGVDYYVEAGRWVFTEHYHLARGYCCRSGCRHCPYGYRKEREEEGERGA
jgi:hypothetical protein